MDAELLAIVEVDKADRIICQAEGCGHGVYKRIHVVRHEDGRAGVYGSDCFERLFGSLVPIAMPRYGCCEARALSVNERALLVDNTERLLAQFETEHRKALEAVRLRREQQKKVERAAVDRGQKANQEAERRRPPAEAELAPYEAEAKRRVREKYDVDPNAPGWKGLVRQIQCELLGR
jgi:hypothetical protein